MPYSTSITSQDDSSAQNACIQAVIFNMFATLMLHIGHRTLYYMVGISQWFFHFIDYFCPFLVLLVLVGFGFIRLQPVRIIRDVLPISLSQLVVSTTTCIVHSGGKYGATYTLRLTDFAVTLTALQLMPMFCSRKVSSDSRPLLILIAVSSSLAWLDFNVTDTAWSTLLVLPLYVLSSAVHYLITFTTQQKLAIKTHELMLYHCGLTSAFLLPMALLQTTDGFNENIGNFFDPISFWRSTDWIVPTCGFVFHASFAFSKYWLLGNFSPESYLVTRHLKYSLGAYMQWFGVNGGGGNLVSSLTNFVALFSAAAYFCRRGSILLVTKLRQFRGSRDTNKSSTILLNGNGYCNGYMNGHMNGHAKKYLAP